jgi:hypothetical protein
MGSDDILKAADHAAKQDDRWLFIALLVIGLITIWFITKYFMAQVVSLTEKVHKIQDNFTSYLQGQNKETVAALAKASMIIEQNSLVIADLKRNPK